MRYFLAIFLVFAGVSAVQAEVIKLMCNSKRGIDQVAIDIAMRSVQVEEFHTYKGFKTHMVLLFQDGGQSSVIQTDELDGEPSTLARRSGPQSVSIAPEQVSFSGSLHSDDRTYEINRMSGLMVLRTVSKSGATFAPVASQCAEVQVFQRKNNAGS